MDNWLIFFNVLILTILIGLLIVMHKKNVSFSKRVFTGMALGIILGTLLQVFYGSDSKVTLSTLDWYSIIGSGYVKLLMVIVVPLVMVSIIRSIINLNTADQLGKMASSVIGTLVLTTLVAAFIGIASALIFDLNADQIHIGQDQKMRGTEIQEKFDTMEQKTMPQRIVNFIPSNIFMDMTGGRPTSVIAVVIFSFLVGIAVLGVRRKDPEHAEMFTKMVDAVFAVVMRLVSIILRLTPFGVLALMANMVASTNFAGIMELGKFVIASYVALITMFIVHLVIVSAFGVNPVTYLKKVIPTLVFAFTSRSSAGTIPLNIAAQKNALGVDDATANMSASFGATMGQNGCAGIYPAMLAVMIAPSAGINPLSPEFIIQLAIITAISSFGVAGVGGGATFAAIIVLSSMGLPIALAGVLITVEPLIDMGRTALNVNGSMVSGTITSRLLGTFNKETFNNKSAVVEHAEA
ncbi:cation:dicarboxylase symporter family transporter [Macrococcus armenti]|uniref:L-cystine transporter n=1 Tax=Macrococcus armenti TaxID=2875764 RepID=UPI001CCC58B0|nr:cation:dicarboxylase symporter family transporter [Macrococcus armenti]UBH22668.1 cation:dicarboxylase symporter family transporter [Macrococcus armenti]